MSRRRVAAKRKVLPDPKYHSQMLAKFINHLMLDGKKSVAEKVTYQALEVALEKHGKTQKQQVKTDKSQKSLKGQSTKSSKRTESEKIKNNQDEDEGEGGEGDSGGNGEISLLPEPLQLLALALENIKPTIEVRSRRVGGATYPVPVEVPESRRSTLGMRWLIQSARKRGEQGMVQRLASEILDALAGRGNAVKKREDVHRMAKANQAFAHFRW